MCPNTAILSAMHCRQISSTLWVMMAVYIQLLQTCACEVTFTPCVCWATASGQGMVECLLEMPCAVDSSNQLRLPQAISCHSNAVLLLDKFAYSSSSLTGLAVNDPVQCLKGIAGGSWGQCQLVAAFVSRSSMLDGSHVGLHDPTCSTIVCLDLCLRGAVFDARHRLMYRE